jgi:hypothetical protein
MRRAALTCLLVAVVASAGSCGGSNIGPTPPPGGGNGGNGGGGGNPNPPANTQPVIETMTVQGTRPRQPANFADLGESIAVSAKVRDEETAVDQLVYAWTATAGTFSGTGANVTWQAPATAPEAVEGLTPATVTITLTITEKFGHPGGPLSFEQSVWNTVSVALHDSAKEVGDMSRQFLLDFSDTNIKDAKYIMRNFGSAATCPEPDQVENEREDVIRNYTHFRMQNFNIGAAAVTVNFGGSCPGPNGSPKGDACARVPVFWDSIDTRSNTRVPTAGTDIVAAAYSPKDSRWFLCASNYDGRNLLTGARITR